MLNVNVGVGIGVGLTCLFKGYEYYLLKETDRKKETADWKETDGEKWG